MVATRKRGEAGSGGSRGLPLVRAGQEGLEQTWEAMLSEPERANLARFTADERAHLERYTPFARTLQLWLNTHGATGWTRARFAREAGIKESTVNTWFHGNVLPDPRAFHKLRAMLGWPDDKLLSLTGYASIPADNPDFLTFMRAELARGTTGEGSSPDARFSRAEAARFNVWLDEVEAAYQRLLTSGQQRPARSRKRRAKGGGGATPQ